MRKVLLFLITLALGFMLFGGMSGAEDINLPATGFSGKYTVYTDTYNGYKLKIPEEFKISDTGATTYWTSPLVDEMAGTIAVNVVELKDSSPQVNYDANYSSMKKNRDFTDVVPVKVKFQGKTIPGFRCSEASHRPGSPQKKAPDDIHRWHLYAFGNGRQYQLSCAGAFSAFTAKKFQATYNEVMKSFEAIPAK